MFANGLIFSILLLFGNGFIEATSQNQYIADEIWNQVEPYTMPDDHPAKMKLDEIFNRSRAIMNIKTMEKAGFINVVPQPVTRIIVTTHPELEGYIVKAYLDNQHYYFDKPEHYLYILRAKGAEKIQNLLDEKGWNHLFKVPKKWIYVLPAEPSPPEKLIRKNFILIEEDMDIFTMSKNKKKWKSDLITNEVLENFHTILNEIGLADCAHPKNASISKDGRIAFVDTQTYNSFPIKYHCLSPFLSKEMRAYWKQIILHKYQPIVGLQPYLD